MKVCFFVGAMIEKGGSERVLSNLTKYFSDYCEVELVTILNSKIAYEIDNRVRVNFLDSNKIDKYKKEMKILKIVKYIKRFRTFNKFLKESQPDIIVSFMPEASFFSMLSHSNKKITKIISVRNDPKREFKNTIYRIMMKLTYNRADGFVFQTEDAKNYFAKKIQNKSKVIPNPINERFADINWNNEKGKDLIVSVGRLEEQKNQQLLIEAFKNVLENVPQAKLKIYGEGSLREKLKEYIKELNISDKVEIPGRVDNVEQYIKDARCFVLSSNYEGMPNALMEAMALGMPVVSTDCPCGGPKYLIKNNENGVLVEVGNVKQMSQAIEKILLDDEFARKIGKNAKEIVNRLNPNKINKEWYNFINEIHKGEYGNEKEK